MLMRWLAVLLICPSFAAAASPAWKDGLMTRLELLALIETLNAELLSHPSATATLEKWCGDHALAHEPKVKAVLERGAEKALDEDGHRLAWRAARRARALPARAAGLRGQATVRGR